MSVPCTLSAKHKWTWLKNSVNVNRTALSTTYALRGIYKCECGERRIGRANQGGPDLRQLLETKP